MLIASLLWSVAIVLVASHNMSAVLPLVYPAVS
jgi:hypothetical protein